MIPNIIYAVKHKNGEITYRNKAVEIMEQIGRYGCFALMISIFRIHILIFGLIMR